MYVILCVQKGERIEGNDELMTCMMNDEGFVELYYIHSVVLYSQCSIIFTVSHYIHSVALYSQCCIIFIVLYYIHSVDRIITN